MVRFGMIVGAALACLLLQAGPARAQMGATPDQMDKLSLEALTARPRPAPRPVYQGYEAGEGRWDRHGFHHALTRSGQERERHWRERGAHDREAAPSRHAASPSTHRHRR